MTARKPKPRKAAPRKGSRATLEQRVSDLERLADWNSDCITVLHNELEALETRKQFRDGSHYGQVSNAGEAIGMSDCNLRPELDARAIEDAWNLAHPVHPRWWQFWRRL